MVAKRLPPKKDGLNKKILLNRKPLTGRVSGFYFVNSRLLREELTIQISVAYVLSIAPNYGEKMGKNC